MHLQNMVTRCAGVCAILGCLAARSSAYFMITQPTRSTQWVNGIANPVTWTKGANDGIAMVDVELSRLSQDGLIFVARNVAGKSSALNIVLQDVPPGDDYFLIFINSTHGVMHATSPRFTILAASSSPNSTQPSPVSAATVTVSGSSNPTQQFATTFAAIGSGVVPRWGSASEAWSLGSVMVGCIIGAAWTLW